MSPFLFCQAHGSIHSFIYKANIEWAPPMWPLPGSHQKDLHSEDGRLYFPNFSASSENCCSTVCVCVYGLYSEMQSACQGRWGWGNQAVRGIFFMHDTKQGVFLTTSVLKCFALGILSDKLPLGDTALPFFHPPTWNLTLLHVKCLISHCLK